MAAASSESVGGFFKAMLPGQATKQLPASSLLADWNAYTQQQGDIEAGTSASTSFSRTAEDMGSSLMGMFRNGYTAVSDGMSNVRAPSLETTIPSGQQLIYFFSFMGGGVVFLALAFMVGLPMLIVSPSKFALCFTLGCSLIMCGFAALKGWKAQLSHMISRERLPFSAGYISSVLLTLYAALILHSYMLSLAASVLQVVALAYYLTSYFPGGTSSVKFMLNMFASAAGQCLAAIPAMFR